MDEDFKIEDLDGFIGDDQPKNIKRSIRDKYKVRLRNLAYTLDDFISHANERLDESKAGKIRNKDETEQLIKKCQALRTLVQVKCVADFDQSDEEMKPITELLGIRYDTQDK